MTLDRSHRRRIFKALVLGRPVEAGDEPFARDKASEVSSRLPHALFMGVVFGVFMGNGVTVLFPLTPSSAALLALGVVAVLIYAVGLGVGFRLWWWLKRQS
jgi:hypothetical protein